MYIANCEDIGLSRAPLDYFPSSLRKRLEAVNLDGAYEIHIAADMPLCVYFSDGRYCLKRGGGLTKNVSGTVKVTRGELEKCIELVTGSSVYALKDEIAGGFITIKGGHRVGICGSGVIRGGEVTFIKDISALNFRLARECIGASDAVMPYIIQRGAVRSTLVISPPGAGKTTMLRDIARSLSRAGKRVSIIDERCEIAAMAGGESAFDLGVSCDVLSGVKKSEGMIMMLRSMSPEVIITDELGGEDDVRAVKRLLNCGVAVIASVHGGADGKQKDILSCFDLAVTLSRRRGAGTVERIDSL
ncbi:MAG: stage III sporulation protein AA [Firmicutes bacterium]|nr:stage III sporulation protein AA [Bacillota bacterium]